MDVKSERFRNAAEFVRLMETRPINKGWQGHERASRDDESDEANPWSGARTWHEAVETAERGYAEVVGRVKAMAKTTTARVFERVEARPVRPVCAYVGGSPHVPRAIQGLPRDMRAMKRKDKKRPGVTLVYEISANGGVNTSDMIAAGARMVALVRLFERAQVPVRLVVSDTGHRGDAGVLACEVVVKDFHAPFNLQKLAYYLAHPSMHRRLFFSWLETSPVVEQYVYGYGYPITNSRRECDEVREDYAARGELWFSRLDFETDEDVIKAWERVTNGGKN